MLKKILFVLLVISIFLPIQNVLAQDSAADPINIYFFWGEGCPHCEKEKPFLETLEEKYPEVKVHDFEVWRSAENRDLLIEAGKKLGTDVSGVPFTVIGDKYTIGYYNDATTGREIENAVKYCLANECADLIAQKDNQGQTENKNETEKIISVPFLGEINAMDFSLPALTIVLGALDGFNPCAMWSLLFLISLLLGMQDRKKMWLLGSVFIIGSGAIYFVFMAAWLNVLLFLGFVFAVRIIIGLAALTGGVWSLRKFWRSRDG